MHRGQGQPVALQVSAERDDPLPWTACLHRIVCHARRGPRRCWATRPLPCTQRMSATSDLIGKKVVLPLVGREIPIIADEYCQPGEGLGRGQDHAGARLQRLRGLQAPPRDRPDQHLRCHGASQRQRAGEISPARPVRCAQAGRCRSARSWAWSTRSSSRSTPSRTPQRGNAVVEPWLTDQWYVECGRAGEAGDRRGREGKTKIRPEELGEDLLRMDAQHPALVHLAPDLVGASDPRVVRAGRQSIRGAQRGGRGRGRQAAHYKKDVVLDTRRGRARHVVLLRAVAVLDAGLARQDAGAETLLSHQRAGHRLRHHLLLGRPHDDDGHALHEGGAVPRRLHPRPRSRREGREDVEVEGQRHRPAGRDRRVRRRRPALHAGGHGGAGPRHQASRSSASRAIATSRPSCGTRRASPR